VHDARPDGLSSNLTRESSPHRPIGAESTAELTAEPDSGLGPRPTCPYGLVCPLTSRPQHRVCEVKKQTRDGTGKRNKNRKEKKKKNKKQEQERGERKKEKNNKKKRRQDGAGATRDARRQPGRQGRRAAEHKSDSAQEADKAHATVRPGQRMPAPRYRSKPTWRASYQRDVALKAP
jgi:hypothetical protein